MSLTTVGINIYKTVWERISNRLLTTVSINGVYVPVEYANNSKETIEQILKEPKVVDYFSNINPDDIVVKKVTILSHFMFGPRVVGFVFMNLDCEDKCSGKKLAGVVFLRGDAVACLILIKEKETGRLYFVQVIQPRVPCGKRIAEICAGMVDAEITKIMGVMVKEIEEETGIKVESTGVKKFDDPKNQFNYLEKLGEVIPSGGGTQEKITLYWYMVEMSREEIQLLHGSEHGEANTNEMITVEVHEFTMANILDTKDAKAISASMYLMWLHPEMAPM
jgi:8-oxo-dGTP pyrophosphatase MutT (NUDIX family)